MGKWKVTIDDPDASQAQDNGNGEFEFDANDTDHDLVYTVTYETDEGCVVSGTYTIQKCECESKMLTKYTSTGSCFCDGIDYEIMLYDKCDVGTILARKTSKLQWSTEDSRWYNYGESYTSYTFSDNIEYNGETYPANITLTSECYVRQVHAELKVSQDSIHGIDLQGLDGNLMATEIYADGEFIGGIDLAGSQHGIPMPNGDPVPWIPTDDFTICSLKTSNFSVDVSLPDEFEGLIYYIDGTTQRLTFVRRTDGYYGAQEMSLVISLTTSARLVNNSSLMVTILYSEINT